MSILNRADPLRRSLALLEIRRRNVLGAIVLGTLALGCAVALAAVAAWLIARASQHPPVMTLTVAAVSVRAFGVGRGTLRYAERLASHDVALRGVARLRENLYARLASGRVEAVATLREGDLLSRTGTDADAIGDVVVRSIIPAGVAVGVSATSVAIVGSLLPSAGLALAVMLAVAGVAAPWLASRAAATTEHESVLARADMTDAALDVLTDTGPLMVSGALEARMDDLRAADTALRSATDRGARTSGTGAALTTLATGLAVVAALLLGAPAVAAGHLTVVELAVVVLTPLASFEAVGVLPDAAVQLRRSREAAGRIMALLDAAAAPEVSERAPELTEPVPVDPSAPVVRARGLACGWSGRPVAVEGVDVDVRVGRSTAIVGPSGIGKTTLLMTLAGLVPPAAGRLERGGAATWTAEDAHVFDTTVLDNLRVARGDVTESEARTALDRVGLSAWLDSSPDGLGTILGSDGSMVSGGERRRLLLARALVGGAPVLLVDEPAEHVDAESVDELLAMVLELAHEGHAVVVATHHLAALERADEVLLLGTPEPFGLQGLSAPANAAAARVVARGTHAELIATSADYRWAVERELPVTRQASARNRRHALLRSGPAERT